MRGRARQPFNEGCGRPVPAVASATQVAPTPLRRQPRNGASRSTAPTPAAVWRQTPAEADRALTMAWPALRPARYEHRPPPTARPALNSCGVMSPRPTRRPRCHVATARSTPAVSCRHRSLDARVPLLAVISRELLPLSAVAPHYGRANRLICKVCTGEVIAEIIRVIVHKNYQIKKCFRVNASPTDNHRPSVGRIVSTALAGGRLRLLGPP
jgi:hypothetical protein